MYKSDHGYVLGLSDGHYVTLVKDEKRGLGCLFCGTVFLATELPALQNLVPATDCVSAWDLLDQHEKGRIIEELNHANGIVTLCSKIRVSTRLSDEEEHLLSKLEECATYDSWYTIEKIMSSVGADGDRRPKIDPVKILWSKDKNVEPTMCEPEAQQSKH